MGRCSPSKFCYNIKVNIYLLSLWNSCWILVVGSLFVTWNMYCMSFVLGDTFIQLCIKICCPIFSTFLRSEKCYQDGCSLVVSCKTTGSNYWDFFFFLAWVSYKSMNEVFLDKVISYNFGVIFQQI